MVLIIPNAAIAGRKIVARKYNENNTAIADAVNANSSDISGIGTTLESCVRIDGSKPFEKPQSYEKYNIQGATWATPIVINLPSHPFSDNDIVYVDEIITGNTAANGQWTITKVDADHFSLNNSVGNGLWTTGGIVYLFSKNNEQLITKLELKKATEKATPFTIISGNVDSNGNPDLFQALVQTPWTSPNMTSRSNADGYVVTGNYNRDGSDRTFQMFNDSVALSAAFTSGAYSKLSFPSSKLIYINTITVTMKGDWSGETSNNYYNSHYGTFTLYKNGVAVAVYPNQSLPSAGGSISITVGGIEADELMVSGLSGSSNSVYDGGSWECAGSIVLNGYELTGTGSNTVVRFKIGGSYDNLKLCYANKQIEEIQKLNNISGMSNGTNYILKIKGQNDAFATLNNVTQGIIFPTAPSDGDYHCLTAKGLVTYKYINSSVSWVETQYIPIGKAIVTGGTIASIASYPFDHNGYNINKYWESSQIAITTGTPINITHNLALDGQKAICVPMLVCTTACQGYSIGDVLQGAFILWNGSYAISAPPILSTNNVYQPIGNNVAFWVAYKNGTSYLSAAEITSNFQYKVKIIY